MTTDPPSANKIQIEKLLCDALEAEHVEVADMSKQHARHAGAIASGGGHYIVTVISPEFVGRTPVARHRLVYQAVAPLKTKIHALGIQAYTPEEWAKL